MNTLIAEIQPREVKFIVGVKKTKSTCTLHLSNVTDHYVAFKVKTTSPKKYCVRPKVGIIKPKETCDLTVTTNLDPKMQCKDKFIIQSTVVLYGTTKEKITPSMFTKESGKYIEETKLMVVLTSSPNSQSKTLADVVMKQEASYENRTKYTIEKLKIE